MSTLEVDLLDLVNTINLNQLMLQRRPLAVACHARRRIDKMSNLPTHQGQDRTTVHQEVEMVTNNNKIKLLPLLVLVLLLHQMEVVLLQPNPVVEVVSVLLHLDYLRRKVMLQDPAPINVLMKSPPT